MYKGNALEWTQASRCDIYVAEDDGVCSIKQKAINRRKADDVVELAARRVRARNGVRNTSRPTTEGILLPQTANPSLGGPASSNKVEIERAGAYGNGGP